MSKKGKTRTPRITKQSKRNKTEFQLQVDTLNAALRKQHREGLETSQLIIQAKRLKQKAGFEDLIRINEKTGIVTFSGAKKNEAKLKKYVDIFRKYESYGIDVARKVQAESEIRHKQFMQEYNINDEQAKVLYKIMGTKSWEKLKDKLNKGSSQIFTMMVSKDAADLDTVMNELKKYTDINNPEYDAELKIYLDEWERLKRQTGNVKGTVTGK